MNWGWLWDFRKFILNTNKPVVYVLQNISFKHYIKINIKLSRHFSFFLLVLVVHTALSRYPFTINHTLRWISFPHNYRSFRLPKFFLSSWIILYVQSFRPHLTKMIWKKKCMKVIWRSNRHFLRILRNTQQQKREIHLVSTPKNALVYYLLI